MKNFHLLPWLIVGALGAAAFILRFVLWGYSFSALVCCCLAGIIAFYEVTGMLLTQFPVVIPILRRIFTVCLVIGIAVVSVTECIIIKASFGSPTEPVDYLVVLGAKVRVTGPSASLWDRIYGLTAIWKPTRMSSPWFPAVRAWMSLRRRPIPCGTSWWRWALTRSGSG